MTVVCVSDYLARRFMEGVESDVAPPVVLPNALDLSALRYVVLDEADEMLDMGFREDLEEILDATPETRRTLMFSATMPRQIAALAKRYQRDALRIEVAKGERGLYVPFNPVKHGLVAEAADWPYSSFHRCVDRGVYPTNWRADGDRGFAAGERSVLCFDGLHPSYRSLRGEFI